MNFLQFFYHIFSVKNFFSKSKKFVKTTYAIFFYFSCIFFASTRSNDYGSTWKKVVKKNFLGTFPVEFGVINLKSSARWLNKCILHKFASIFFQESSKIGSLVLNEKQTPPYRFYDVPISKSGKKICAFFF